MILGTIVPHHVPYNFQGDLHLFLAYTSFFVLIVITYFNAMHRNNPLYRNLLFLSLFASFLLYLHYLMVNTLIEILIMLTCLSIDLFLCLKSFK